MDTNSKYPNTPSANIVGRIVLTTHIAPAHLEYLKMFCAIKHYKRDNSFIRGIKDRIRFNAGLCPGIDGEFFIGKVQNSSTTAYLLHTGVSDVSININDGSQPSTMPHSLCCWRVQNETIYVEHEKKYKIIGSILWNNTPTLTYFPYEWLLYLQNKFLIPWGYNIMGNYKIEYIDYNNKISDIISISDNKITLEAGNPAKAEKYKPNTTTYNDWYGSYSTSNSASTYYAIVDQWTRGYYRYR